MRRKLIPTIDKSIPMPKPRYKYPFKQMEVGDSVFIPFKSRQDLGNSLTLAERAIDGRFASRSETDETGRKGVRVWRVS